MKHLTKFLLASFTALLFYQCQKDTIVETPINDPLPPNDTVQVTGPITVDVTWTSGKTYILNDMIAVTNNAVLTIQPCVVVKATNGATGLIIDRGARIEAKGTSECPIIFTSVEDNLVPGEILSPNLGGSDIGLWSGIYILGNAPVSSMNAQNVVPLDPMKPVYTYGGNAPADNSGTFQYVSIRHTGFETTTDEVPCGLNLAGVGSGTTIDHVELFANVDDGFLVLGGTVAVTDIVTSSFNDDGCDIDLGYAGSIQNLIGIGGTSGNSALELDGGEGADNPSFTIKNISFKGAQSNEDYIDFQSSVHCKIEQAYFFGFDADAIVKLDRDMDADNWLAEAINVTNLQFKTSHLNSGNTTIESIFVDAGSNGNDAFTIRKPDAQIVTQPTTGANKSSFTGWTIADLTGALNEF